MKILKTCQECKKDIDKMKYKSEFFIDGKKLCNDCMLSTVVKDEE